MGTADHAHDQIHHPDMASDAMPQYSLADSGEKVMHNSRQEVVELTANGSGSNNSGGKMKKSSSGFLKGLLRNKSSGSLAEGDASAPASESGSVYAAENSSTDVTAGKKKGVKKLLSLGRKKKNGSSASLSEHATELEAADAET